MNNEKIKGVNIKKLSTVLIFIEAVLFAASIVLSIQVYTNHKNVDRITDDYIEELRNGLAETFDISFDDTQYLYSINTIEKNMYDFGGDGIKLLMTDGTMKDICDVSELLNAALQSCQKPKYYVSFQRNA